MDRRAYLITLLSSLSGCGLNQDSGKNTSSGVTVIEAAFADSADPLSVDAQFVNVATEQSAATLLVMLTNQSETETLTVSSGGYLPFDMATSTDGQYVLSAENDSRTAPSDRTQWTGDCWKLEGEPTSYPVGVSEELTAGGRLRTRYLLFALEECVSGTFEFGADVEVNGSSKRMVITVRID
jgi:hypothetical protein